MKDPKELFKDLINFRKSLGVDADKNDYKIELNPIEQVKLQLESVEGIDVEFDEIEPILDGSLLSYKENLAILYISDTNKSKSYLLNNELIRKSPKGRGDEAKGPKFHFSWCSTLEQMRNNKRYDRYVLVRNADGLFRVFAKEDRYAEAYELEERVKLYVCENCLGGRLGKDTPKKIGYKGFHKDWTRAEKYQAVEQFDIKEFLDENEGIFNSIKHQAKHTDKTTQANNYTSDFAEISRKLREDSEWICSNCNVDMKRMKKGLHVHHINGVRYDNSISNLRVLCAKCHQNVDEFHKSMNIPKDIMRFIERNQKK